MPAILIYDDSVIYDTPYFTYDGVPVVPAGTAEAFRIAVTESHTYARQLFVCDPYGTIIEQIPLDPGSSIENSANLVRRSGTLVIPNRDGRYTPGAGVIEFGRSFLLRYVVVQTDGPHLGWNLPLLYASTDEIDSGDRRVTIPVSDGMRIIGSDASLSRPVSYADGTPLEDVIRAILVANGAPDEDRYFDLRTNGALLVGDHGYEIGVLWSEILNQLLVDYSLDLWSAYPVVYTLRPIPDPTDPTLPIAATWRLGSQVRLLGLRVKRTSLARNHAVVDGLDPYGRPFTIELFDENPASPVQYGKPGVGDLSVYWKSDGITSPEQAKTVARSLLVDRAPSRDFDASVPLDPSLERRDLVRIVHDEWGIDAIAMLDEFPLPVAPGAQTFSVREARSLV